METVKELDYEKKYEAMVKRVILDLFENTNARIFLFGSRARGDFKKGADFDVGVESIDQDIFQKLKLKFDEFWEESIIPYKVDLVHFEQTNQKFQEEARKDMIIWKED